MKETKNVPIGDYERCQKCGHKVPYKAKVCYFCGNCLGGEN